jgi:hypothetical protein
MKISTYLASFLRLSTAKCLVKQEELFNGVCRSSSDFRYFDHPRRWIPAFAGMTSKTATTRMA